MACSRNVSDDSPRAEPQGQHFSISGLEPNNTLQSKLIGVESFLIGANARFRGRKAQELTGLQDVLRTARASPNGGIHGREGFHEE